MAVSGIKFNSILSQGRTRCRTDGGSKKRVLEDVATLIAADYPAVNADDLFRRLIARERLGSTAVGSGVAIPHCRIQNATGTTGALLYLSEPIDFEAPDNQPVDIIFALLVPEEAHDEHLQTLAALAQGFSVEANLKRLRATLSDEELFRNALEIFGNPS